MSRTRLPMPPVSQRIASIPVCLLILSGCSGASESAKSTTGPTEARADDRPTSKSMGFIQFRETPEGRAFVETLRFTGGNYQKIDVACNNPAPSAAKIVNIRIRNDYKNIERMARIRTRDYDAVNDKGTGAASSPNQVVLPVSRKTRLDLDVKNLFTGTSNAVRVKVVIRDDDLAFLSKSEAVTVDSNSTAWVCGRTHKLSEADDETGGKSRESFSFFVRKNSAYDPTKPIRFNINVVVEDDEPAYSMPIVLDPVIKNDG